MIRQIKAFASKLPLDELLGSLLSGAARPPLSFVEAMKERAGKRG